MFTFLLLPSNDNYCHVAKCTFYSKTKIEKIYIFNFFRKEEELIHKSNKAPYKLDMSYFPFLYHILNITQTRKKCLNPYNFNHSPLHKDKYNFLPCSFLSFSHKCVTHKHLPNANDLIF
jgi:hypothetical protein